MTDLSRKVAEVMGYRASRLAGNIVTDKNGVNMICPDYTRDLNLAITLVPDDADLTLEGNDRDGWWACIHHKDKNISEAATGEHKIHASAICLARLDFEDGLRALQKE